MPTQNDRLTAEPVDIHSEKRNLEKLIALRAALDEDLASGIYEGDVFAELRAELHGNDTDA